MAFTSSLVSSLAWPVIVLVLVCLIWFTVPQQARVELLQRVRKVGPGGAEFDKAELDQASSEVSEASSAVTHDATVRPPSISATASVGTPTVSATDAGEPRGEPDQATKPVEMDTRTLADTQRLIAAAAKWGWIRAGRDAADFPYPMVTWSKDGAKIVGSRLMYPGDTVTYAAGSYIDPNTGNPNTSARTFVVPDVDPL